MDQPERISISLDVRAIFRADPLTAYDRLAPSVVAQDTTSATIGDVTLSLLAPSSFSYDGTAHWTEPDAPSWLELDPRWLTLCAELSQDRRHGDTARAVLRHAGSDLVLPALEAARAKRAPLPAPLTRATGDLPARYRAGDHMGAWREARAVGAVAGDLRAEIVALADETMARVARNVALVSERLQQAGWRTLDPLRTLPEHADAERMAAIERMTGGLLPPSLEAFWRIVGGVCWVWDYDQDEAPSINGLDLSRIDTDAFWIVSCATVERLCFEEWEDQRDEIHPDLVGPFQLELSPDRLHKMNVSGGPSHGIELPFRGADPPFQQEDRSLPFVDYLRDCFAWAGFPHLSHHADQAAVHRFIDRMGQGLEPF